jgi:cyanophycin synthetase
VFDEHPFKVLFDYGHNAHAVGMLADLAQRLEVKGRRIVVLAGPGDRRDEDLIAIADAVAGRFDHYVCRRDDNLRDRAPDEVPRIQAIALRAAGVSEDAISVIPDEQQAIEAALNMGREGDLLLVFADALVRSWKQVTKFRMQGATYSSPAGEPAAVAGAADTEARSLHVAGPGGSQSTASPSRPGRPAAGESEQGPDGGGTMPAALNLDGLIRDERGVRFAPESDD